MNTNYIGCSINWVNGVSRAKTETACMKLSWNGGQRNSSVKEYGYMHASTSTLFSLIQSALELLLHTHSLSHTYQTRFTTHLFFPNLQIPVLYSMFQASAIESIGPHYNNVSVGRVHYIRYENPQLPNSISFNCRFAFLIVSLWKTKIKKRINLIHSYIINTWEKRNLKYISFRI